MALVEGIDYYLDNGLMVLTEHFLKKRGKCCNGGCRHCPYKLIDNPTKQNHVKIELDTIFRVDRDVEI